MLGGIRNLGSLGGIAGGAGQLAAGAGAGVTAGIAGAVVRDVQQTGHSPWDQGAGELYAASHEQDEHGGPTRTDLENHYLQRTGALTAAGIDWEKERALWQRETPDERRKLEDADSRRRWGWVHDTLGWIKGALLPNAHADDSPLQSEPGHEIRYVHAPQDAPETLAPERSNQQDSRWPAPPETGLPAENIDLERLTGAVAMQESGGNANAVSSVGAQGLLQLMPATARGLGVTDPFDADQSWSAGQKYLSQLLLKYHDQMKALAAYNWGPGNLDKDLKKHGDQWRAYLPRETSDYLMRVGRNYETGNVVHHHNTTNSPNISIAINGAGKSAHEIAQEVARTLPQQMAQNDQKVM
ncbi:transglycosylase SLT domain-containing protein [Bombella apis]|nr:transglycosylase SLT domain-containing protein [Bombella apis]